MFNEKKKSKSIYIILILKGEYSFLSHFQVFYVLLNCV